MRTAPRVSLGALACVLGLALADIAYGASDGAANGQPAAGATKRTTSTHAKPNAKPGDTRNAAAPALQKKRVKKTRPKKTTHTTAKTPRSTSRLTLAAQTDAVPGPFINEAALPPVTSGACPSDMVSIDQRYCVDKYEASLVEVTATGEQPFSPYDLVDGHDVRAQSVAGVFPQGYISGAQAKEACSRSGKRLCKAMEWRKACAGPDAHTYGYADTRQRGVCNDAGRSPMLEIWHLGGEAAANLWDPLRMNDSRLNQLPGSLALTGAHPSCTNAYGVFDMVGNLHEWVDDPSGTFQGGYYLDTTINGEGCGYRTSAHDFSYHDYSTGFRCCADPE